ncbi:MAG: hypothetical protein IKX54_01670 [Lachnospiraceae bacterium]|nr:hypothetical protein [Lachnospiraceae bacterium]
MKKSYFFATTVLGAIVTAVCLAAGFSDFGKNSRSDAEILTLAGIAFACTVASIVGFARKFVVKGIFLVKVGIVLFGLGVLFFAGAAVDNKVTSSVVIELIVFAGLGIAAFLFGRSVCLKNRVAEEPKAEASAPAAPKNTAGIPAREGAGVRRIWQYMPGAKPQLTDRQKRIKRTVCTYSLLCAIAGLVLPFVIGDEMFRKPGGEVLFILAVVSIIVFAFTLGMFKKHNTQNKAFVLGEDGSVFLIDYFDVRMAKELGYYGLLPEFVRTGGMTYVGKTAWTLNQAINAANMSDVKRFLTFLRQNGVDRRIAENRMRYGYQITSVPEVVKCGYCSRIRFRIRKDGHELAYSDGFDLYDNSYEGYDEMVDYFTNAFEHEYGEAYQKKTKNFRTALIVGALIALGGIGMWLYGSFGEDNTVKVAGLLFFVLGTAPFAAGLNGLWYRHK